VTASIRVESLVGEDSRRSIVALLVEQKVHEAARDAPSGTRGSWHIGAGFVIWPYVVFRIHRNFPDVAIRNVGTWTT
jgi:hypothetical protein